MMVDGLDKRLPSRMQDYTRLQVWHRARSLTVAIHEATRRIPSRSAPGLTSQLMRATMSIGATIAEGAGRETRPDFARFITMAISSTTEVEHHLSVCTDLGLLEDAVVARLTARCVEIRKMLFGLRRALLEAEDADGRHRPAVD
jgi:four helix bundle protein